MTKAPMTRELKSQSFNLKHNSDRLSVDEEAAFALVGDVELAAGLQLDDALPPRNLPRGPFQLQVDVDALVFGCATEGYLEKTTKA